MKNTLILVKLAINLTSCIGGAYIIVLIHYYPYYLGNSMIIYFEFISKLSLLIEHGKSY